MRLRMFTRKNWIIARKGKFEPGAKKIAKLIGESARIGLLNVLVIRKREVDFQPFQGICICAGCVLRGFLVWEL